MRLCRKDLLETNNLAYHKHSFITEIKYFITIGAGVNLIKLFLFAADALAKLECLSLKNHYSLAQNLRARGPLQSGAHERLKPYSPTLY
jgi:hypothetical protein